MSAADVHERRCRSRSCRHLGMVPHRIRDEGETADTWWIVFECHFCTARTREEFPKVLRDPRPEDLCPDCLQPLEDCWCSEWDPADEDEDEGWGDDDEWDEDDWDHAMGPGYQSDPPTMDEDDDLPF